MLPVRDTASLLAATENRTEPSPCPAAGCASVTHAVSVCAAHWQSRLVPMRTVPEPPPAGNDGASAVAWRVHLLDDGLVRVSVFEEDPQAEATSAAATTVANIADERAVVRNATVATGSRRPTRAARVHCRLPRRAVPRSN